MATRALTKVYPTTAMEEQIHRGSIRIMKWEGLTNTTSDLGEALGLDYASYTERTVQVIGTFGTGGTCAIEGSIDGTTWATLNDPQGNALAVTTAKIETLLEATPYLRPSITAGDGSTDLDVFILLRQDRL